MEPENGTGVEGVFQYLAREMANVSSPLNVQGVSQIVQCFDGNAKNFRDWVKQIEKYCTLTGLPEARKRLTAYQSSKGAVRGFINRYMEAFSQSTWAEIKTELANKFSDVTDSRYALSLLRSIRQNPGKNNQLYAERKLSLAKEAFLGQGGDVVERQLINTFVDGLVGNVALKMKILRDNPDTLQGVIATATKEQNLRARASLLMLWLFVGPTGVYLLDFFCSGIQFNLLLSPYPCFISLLYLVLYVLGVDALIS